jgi:hypothetical protein
VNDRVDWHYLIDEEWQRLVPVMPARGAGQPANTTELSRAGSRGAVIWFFRAAGDGSGPFWL